jgi:hypothetical protein
MPLPATALWAQQTARLGNSSSAISKLDYSSYLDIFSFHPCTLYFITSTTLKSCTCHVYTRYFSAWYSLSCINPSRYAISNAVPVWFISLLIYILEILLYFAAQVSRYRNLRCVWRGPAPSRWAVTWLLSHFYLSAFLQQHPPLRGTPWSQGSSTISPVRCIVFTRFSFYWSGAWQSIS